MTILVGLTAKLQRLAESRVGHFLVWLAAAVFTVGGLAAIAQDIGRVSAWPHNTDTELYIIAARAVAEGGNPYANGLYAYDPYAYPPLLAEVLSLVVGVIGDGWGWLTWTAICIVCFAGAIVVLTRGFGYKTPWRWVALFFGATLAAHVTRIDIVHGQVNFHVLLLLLVGLRQHIAGRNVWAALAWGVMFSLKPFMGVAILFLVRRGEWRATLLSLAAGIAIFGATLLIWGARMFEILQGWLVVSRYYTSMPFVAKPDNQSFYGFFQRAFSPNTFGVEWIDAPALILPLTAIVVVAAAALFFVGIASKRFHQDAEDERGVRALMGMGITLALAMACGPLFEGDYPYFFLPALFGSVILAMRRSQAGASTATLHLFAAAVWVLAFVLHFFPIGLPILRPHLWGSIEGIRVLASLRNGATFFFAAGVSAYALWRDRETPSGQAGPTAAT